MKFLEARDKIIKPFYDIWQPTGLFVAWDDLQEETPIDNMWSRVTLNHFDGYQDSLSNAYGKLKWRRTGLISIQLFNPISNGRQDLYSMSQSIVDNYQRVRNTCIWFRNPRMIEAAVNGYYYQINVNVDFQYVDVV
jgi:hypothetical protein